VISLERLNMKIEKNIPIPIDTLGRKDVYKDFINKMEVSDSVLCTPREYDGMLAAAKFLGVKLTSRTIAANRRVWRLT